MSESKNYNRMVFLTTLSVYLGLVLVGATPPVMAHAALTQRIEIQNEIESDDDLDKKPEGDEIKLSGPTGGYFDDLQDLIEDLQQLHRIEKFDLDFDSFHVKQSEAFLCGLKTVRHAVTTSNIDKLNNKWLVPAITDAAVRFEDYAFLGDCLPDDNFDKKDAVGSELEISYDRTAFEFKLSIKKESPQKARLLSEKFYQARRTYELDEEEIIIKKIYDNTNFTFENNQVFIVTRLPRASIDALLAEKTAK